MAVQIGVSIIFLWPFCPEKVRCKIYHRSLTLIDLDANLWSIYLHKIIYVRAIDLVDVNRINQQL